MWWSAPQTPCRGVAPVWWSAPIPHGGWSCRELMGKLRRLPADRASRRALPRCARARARLPRVHGGAPQAGAARAGRPLHGLRGPLLPQRLPAGQLDPRLERPRLPRPLARGDRAAARDQQLPRLHRAPLPRPVRGGVRAGDPRGRRGDDQTDRARDRRARFRGGLDQAEPPSPRHAPASASPSSARARRGWPPPSSCAARGTA